MVVDMSQRGRAIEVKLQGDDNSGEKLLAAVFNIPKGETQLNMSEDRIGDACAKVIARILPWSNFEFSVPGCRFSNVRVATVSGFPM